LGAGSADVLHVVGVVGVVGDDEPFGDQLT